MLFYPFWFTFLRRRTSYSFSKPRIVRPRLASVATAARTNRCGLRPHLAHKAGSYVRHTLPRSCRPCPSAPPSKRKGRFCVINSCLRETPVIRPISGTANTPWELFCYANSDDVLIVSDGPRWLLAFHHEDWLANSPASSCQLTSRACRQSRSPARLCG